MRQGYEQLMPRGGKKQTNKMIKYMKRSSSLYVITERKIFKNEIAFYWVFGIDMYTLLYLKEITNKDLL